LKCMLTGILFFKILEVMMANHHSRAQWRTWIEACQQSDLTIANFCESIGVSVHTYYRWRRRLRDEPVATDSLAGKFVPLALPENQIEIELPGGSIARITNDTCSLRPLVTLLLELGAGQ